MPGGCDVIIFPRAGCNGRAVGGFNRDSQRDVMTCFYDLFLPVYASVPLSVRVN